MPGIRDALIPRSQKSPWLTPQHPGDRASHGSHSHPPQAQMSSLTWMGMGTLYFWNIFVPAKVILTLRKTSKRKTAGGTACRVQNPWESPRAKLSSRNPLCNHFTPCLSHLSWAWEAQAASSFAACETVTLLFTVMPYRPSSSPVLASLLGKGKPLRQHRPCFSHYFSSDSQKHLPTAWPRNTSRENRIWTST